MPCITGLIVICTSMIGGEPSVTQTLGAFIKPVEAKASTVQAGRVATRLVDESGWGETLPGSGIYGHSNNVYAEGSSMWNGGLDKNTNIVFDLGKDFSVNGMYVWNYNENGWTSRSVKELSVLTSLDGKEFLAIGAFKLKMASGKDDDRGEAVDFGQTVKTRFIKFEIKSNYRNGEQAGLSEVRFSNAVSSDNHSSRARCLIVKCYQAFSVFHHVFSLC